MNCIINVALRFWYPKGQRRLIDSISKYNIPYKVWENHYPAGCPTHEKAPYAFKPYAFKAAKEQGHTNILWCDSAVWAQHNPTPIFNKMKEDGYFVIRNGWTTGNWSSDEQLRAFGYSREEAFTFAHPMACAFGINFDHPIGQTIFQEYFDNVHLFRGSWKNENNHLGGDPRIMGTRHDQTILGLIMYKHKLNYTNPQGWIDYGTENKESILLSQGMTWTAEEYEIQKRNEWRQRKKRR